MVFKAGDVDPLHVHLVLERLEFNNAPADEWVPQMTYWNVQKDLVQKRVEENSDHVESYRSHGWDVRWRVFPAVIGRQVAWTVNQGEDDAPGVLEA